MTKKYFFLTNEDFTRCGSQFFCKLQGFEASINYDNVVIWFYIVQFSLFFKGWQSILSHEMERYMDSRGFNASVSKPGWWVLDRAKTTFKTYWRFKINKQRTWRSKFNFIKQKTFEILSNNLLQLHSCLQIAYC